MNPAVPHCPFSLCFWKFRNLWAFPKGTECFHSAFPNLSIVLWACLEGTLKFSCVKFWTNHVLFDLVGSQEKVRGIAFVPKTHSRYMPLPRDALVQGLAGLADGQCLCPRLSWCSFFWQIIFAIMAREPQPNPQPEPPSYLLWNQPSRCASQAGMA